MNSQGILINDWDWLILIWDPDGSDTSPWNVSAPDLDSAIVQAKADWHASLYDPDDPDSDPGEPEVHKVYRSSWIGERVL